MNWKSKKVLITGGAGFIGSNLAKYLMESGAEVVIFDNLSRKNVEKNLEWLKSCFQDLKFINGDVRELADLEKAAKSVDMVFHEAAQVAVTDSVSDPLIDFDINASGTLNMLEAVRKVAPEAIVVYASTNKVYGGLEHLDVVEDGDRYKFADPLYQNGVSESVNLDFHSPYGCSKGSADQYVRDYARIYGMKTLVFRQSCIYGPRQWGTEDQGWVFHFLKESYLGSTLKIYGDGKQVRDLLFIDDLIKGYEMAIENIEQTQGQVYNMGGGQTNSVSLLQAIEIMDQLLGEKIKYKFYDWRPGDQRVFISDNSKAQAEFSWKPETDIKSGFEKMLGWVKEIN
jgi:CDP-paratose 2-epimerase